VRVQTPLYPLLDKCFGKVENGRCSTDPDSSGVVRKDPSCCSGKGCPEFPLGKVISSKIAGCGKCNDKDVAAPKVPEKGELKVKQQLTDLPTFVPGIKD
jgi:hypothetical protein